MKSVNVKTIYFYILLFDSIAVAVAIFLGINSENPLKHFEEDGFITFFSVFQLLIISLLSLIIFWISKKRKGYFSLRHSSTLWAIISMGFLFLAIDEHYKIHERIDFKIHYIFNIQETGITDRIDDLIIALYALVGIFILYLYREELTKYKKAFLFIKYGLICLFTMVLLDILSNRGDILGLFIKNYSLVDTLIIWFSVIEDSLKIFAEGFFLIGFYAVLNKASKKSLVQS